MAGGLFSSLYNKQGIYEDLYSRDGGSPPLHRADLRLGGLGQEEDEEEEEVATAAPTATASDTKPRPTKGFFHTHIFGLPTWLLGVAFLGFAFTYRRKTKN